jgi:hypothetical protein
MGAKKNSEDRREERRIEEILNKEKLDSCLRRNDKKPRGVRPHPARLFSVVPAGLK